MSANQLLDLQKAAKLQAFHHKKAAAHHEAKAAGHLKAHEAHKQHAEEHEELMAAAKTAGQDHLHKFHKAAHAFHKSKAVHHEKMHKAHAGYAEHHKKMADAYGEADADKAFKIVGIETAIATEPATVPATEPGEPMSKTDITPTPVAERPVTAAAAQPPEAVVAPVVKDGPIDLGKALEAKLGTAVEEGFARIMNSPEFNKRIDEVLQAKLLEKLGSTPTEIKSIPVPRAAPTQATYNATLVDTSKIDPTLSDLVKFD